MWKLAWFSWLVRWPDSLQSPPPPLSGFWLMKAQHSMEWSWVGRSGQFKSNQFYLSPVFIHENHSHHWNSPFVSMKQNHVAFLMIMNSWQVDWVGELSDVIGWILNRNVFVCSSGAFAVTSPQERWTKWILKSPCLDASELGEKNLFICWNSVRFTENTADELGYLWIFVLEEA